MDKVIRMRRVKVGKYIRSKRMEIGLSVEDMARILNINDKEIIKWESGSTIPDELFASHLAEVFNTNVENILNCEELMS